MKSVAQVGYLFFNTKTCNLLSIIMSFGYGRAIHTEGYKTDRVPMPPPVLLLAPERVPRSRVPEPIPRVTRGSKSVPVPPCCRRSGLEGKNVRGSDVVSRGRLLSARRLGFPTERGSWVEERLPSGVCELLADGTESIAPGEGDGCHRPPSPTEL